MNEHIKKYARWVIRAILCLVLLCIVGLGVIYWFLQRDPHQLASRYLGEIAAKTGLEFSFNSVEVTLLPLPAIAISDLAIKGSRMDFTTALLTARPTFANLLRGEIMPGHISLARPKLSLSTNLPLVSPGVLAKELEKEFFSLEKNATGESLLPYKCEICISQGHAEVRGAGGTLASIGNLDTDLAIFATKMITGKAGFSYLRLADNGDNLVSLENFSLAGEKNFADFLNNSGKFVLEGKISLGNWLSAASFAIDFDGAGSDWRAFANIEGNLSLDGVHVPASLCGRFVCPGNSGEITISDAQWSLDMDSGGIDATFRLPQKKLGWQLGGTLTAHRLSLTQWLGFARNLAPGLQIALDNIFNARMDFILDATGLKVPEIAATCTGARFTGKGGVESFANPVVFLDLKSEKANLGLAIPEALAKSPLPVHFPYAPLTPMPGEPLKPGETGIGYDIRLAAKDLIYGPLHIRNASLRIYPGKLDKTGLEDVLLDGKGNFYGGTVSGKCILGADPSMPINIAASAKGINGGAVASDLPKLPFKKGKFNASANVFSKGKHLDIFMASLKGPVNVSGANVTLAAKGAPAIAKLDLNADLRGAREEKAGASFTALWKAAADLADLSADIRLDGRLSFGKSGMTIKSVPATFSVTTRKELGPLPGNTKIHADCVLSGNSDDGKYVLSKLATGVAGVNMRGEITVDCAKSSFNGNLVAETADLSRTARNLGAFFSVPASLQKLKIETAVSANANELKLGKIRGNAGATSFTGEIKFLKKAKPTFDFALQVDKLDWDKQIGKSGARSQAKKWNFRFLTDFNAKGTLKVKDFRGWGIHITSLDSPLNLENGRLSVGPSTAVYCGAAIQSRAHVDFNNGIVFNAILAAHDFNLEQAARDRKIESALTGKASLDARVNGNLTGPGQMPAHLNGDWSFVVKSGSWQSRNSKGQLTGSPTTFSRVSASGKIVRGVAESSNFNMQSNGLQVNGGGKINLVSAKIDCNFNVNMKNLPDFPLHVYGSLDKPRTSIGAGKMVINAIGGITTGIANIFGSLVQGAWDIFR